VVGDEADAARHRFVGRATLRDMKLTSLFAAAALVLVWTASATADVIPPDVTACQGKAQGDGCMSMTGTTGTCQPQTCSSIQYYPDGGHGSQSYACLECTASDAGAAEDAATGSDAGAGGDAGTTSSNGTSGGSNGCSYGRAGSMASAFALAALVPVLVRRRRPR
jgi:hypothetical protein